MKRISSRFLGLFLAIVLCFGGLPPVVPTWAADTLAVVTNIVDGDVYFLRQASGGGYMDVSGTIDHASDGHSVTVKAFRNHDDQRWKIFQVDGGWQIWSVGEPEMLLNVVGATYISGVAVDVRTHNSGITNAQRFDLVRMSDGSFRIETTGLLSSTCVSFDGEELVQKSINDDADRRWFFEELVPVDDNEPPDEPDDPDDPGEPEEPNDPSRPRDEIADWFSKDSNVYNHALATWALDVAYHAYRPHPDGYPGREWLTLPEDETIYKILEEYGFDRRNIERKNIETSDATQHTFAYMDVNFGSNVSPENVISSGEALAINNFDGGMDDGIFDKDLNDSLWSFSSSTEPSLSRNTVPFSSDGRLFEGSTTRLSLLSMETDLGVGNRPLVVVAIRGSGTNADWFYNVGTQLYWWWAEFEDRKDEVLKNLRTYLSDKELTDKNPIIFITGHSHGAAVGNLLAADLNTGVIEGIEADDVYLMDSEIDLELLSDTLGNPEISSEYSDVTFSLFSIDSETTIDEIVSNVSKMTLNVSNDPLAINNFDGGMDDGVIDEGFDRNGGDGVRVSERTLVGTSYVPAVANIWTSGVIRARLAVTGYGEGISRNILEIVDRTDSLTYNKTAADNTRPLVVVAIRGSGTTSDWLSNFTTAIPPLAILGTGQFSERKDVVRENLKNYLSANNIQNPLIFITGLSHGAAVANLLVADLNTGKAIPGIDTDDVYFLDDEIDFELLSDALGTPETSSEYSDVTFSLFSIDSETTIDEIVSNVSKATLNASNDTLAINNFDGGMDDDRFLGATSLYPWSTLNHASIYDTDVSGYGGSENSELLVGSFLGYDNATFSISEELTTVGKNSLSVNSRPLVVVAIRGSGTDADWDVNLYTQTVFWLRGDRQTFSDRKQEVLSNLKDYLKEKELKNPIVFITGHSHGAAVGNLLAAG
jgi:hypothetical protein